MQANLFRIRLAKNFKWTMLCNEAFTNMMKDYGINHITSSPHYPQSNGLAEMFVQIVKNLVHKAKEEGNSLFKCLMIHHNTPLSSSLQSPMQILQRRSARSDLPMSNVARKNHTVHKTRRVKMNIIYHNLVIADN